jgi:hypothetical protein
MTFHLRTELLFPPRLIPELRDLRGPEWQALVDRIVSLPETHTDKMAFCLMMIRLNACMGCISGSYRFMRGCELCSQQTISRFQGTDEELLALYEKAREDLVRHDESGVEIEAEISAESDVEEEEPEIWE